MTSNLKPFIPAWLDDLGLSQAEFRLYCHLCRRAGNETGIAYPSAETATKNCGMAKNTFWKTVERLEKRRLIERIGKKFGSSNRYRVIVPIGANGIPIETPIVSNGMPIEDDTNRRKSDMPIVSNEILQSAQMATHQSAQMATQKGNPSKGIQGRKSNKESKSFTTESVQFAQWFKSSLPENTNLSANWRESFAQEFENMVRIDKRSPDEIRQVCRWARQDEFWRSNFYSPVKLRKRKDGVQYYDILLQKMKSAKPPASVPSTPSNPSLRTPTFI
jgi:hypothetical protein